MPEDEQVQQHLQHRLGLYVTAWGTERLKLIARSFAQVEAIICTAYGW